MYVAKRRVLGKLAFRRVNEFYLAEDIIQNTIEVACKNAIKKSRVYDFEKWLYAVLKYKCYDVFKKRSKIQYYRDELLNSRIIEDEVNVIENLNLYQLLACLDDVERKSIIYRFVYGLTYKEIALIFGCCSGTAKRRIDRGLKIMITKME